MKQFESRAVPEQQWPAGLQILHRVEAFMQEAARSIVQQLSLYILSSSTRQVLSDCGDEKNLRFRGLYQIGKASGDLQGYKVTPYCGCIDVGRLPAALKDAVVEVGRWEHLRISFEFDCNLGEYIAVTVSTS